jgi:hypothetical protein
MAAVDPNLDRLADLEALDTAIDQNKKFHSMSGPA